jgi:hypothetical protein
MNKTGKEQTLQAHITMTLIFGSLLIITLHMIHVYLVRMSNHARLLELGQEKELHT